MFVCALLFLQNIILNYENPEPCNEGKPLNSGHFPDPFKSQYMDLV